MDPKIKEKILNEIKFLLSEASLPETIAILNRAKVEAVDWTTGQKGSQELNKINYLDFRFGNELTIEDLETFVEATPTKYPDINKKLCNYGTHGFAATYGRVRDLRANQIVGILCKNGVPNKVKYGPGAGNTTDYTFVNRLIDFKRQLESQNLISKIPEVIPSPVPTPAPGPSPAPAPPTDPSSGELTGTSFRCKDSTLIVKFQKYLKSKGSKICADGKFGPKTFAAAKPLVNFSMYPDFNAFKNQAQRDQLCNAIAGDSRYRQFDGKPEVCRKSTPSPKPPTQPQTQQDVLRTLAASDTGWQQKMNQEQTNKFVSAYNQNQAFKNAVDAAAKKGVLNTDWIFNNYKNYIRQPMAESYNFYDKQKVDGANLLYEKLIKKIV